jgi:hypothetical protein
LTEPSLFVRFYKGVVIADETTGACSSWAETPFGLLGFLEGSQGELHTIAPDRIENSQQITTVELTGLDREGVELIVLNILQRGLLDKPGIASKGDAVLYVLLNEVLHELQAIARLESKEEDRSVDQG